MYTIILLTLLILTGSSSHCAQSGKQNPHTILGIDKNATTAEIKAAYKKLAVKYHPDKNGGKRDQFEAAKDAYEALINPGRKSHFDQQVRSENWLAAPLTGIAIGVCIFVGVIAIDRLMKYLAKPKENEDKKIKTETAL